MEQLLTTEEIMQLFNCTRQTVYNWVKRRDLPVVRIPGNKLAAVRFSKKAVLKWSRQHKQPTF